MNTSSHSPSETGADTADDRADDRADVTAPNHEDGADAIQGSAGHQPSGAVSAGHPPAGSPLPPNAEAATAYGNVRGFDPARPEGSETDDDAR